jgi:hypothetical protein
LFCVLKIIGEREKSTLRKLLDANVAYTSRTSRELVLEELRKISKNNFPRKALCRNSEGKNHGTEHRVGVEDDGKLLLLEPDGLHEYTNAMSLIRRDYAYSHTRPADDEEYIRHRAKICDAIEGMQLIPRQSA